MAHCQTRWANRACLLGEIGSVLYAFLSNWNLLHTISFSEEIIMLSIQVSRFIFNLICMNRGQGQGLGSSYNIFQCSDPSAWPWAKVWAVGLLEIAKLETAAFWIAMVKQWWKHMYQCGWMWFHWFCTLYKTCGFTFNWAFALQKLHRSKACKKGSCNSTKVLGKLHLPFLQALDRWKGIIVEAVDE